MRTSSNSTRAGYRCRGAGVAYNARGPPVPFRPIAASVYALASIAAAGGNRTLQTPTRFHAGNSTALTTIFAGDFTADGKKNVLVSETGKIQQQLRDGLK